MRLGAYSLFEIVAWPAAAWCAVELMLRVASRSFDGLPAAALTGGLAVLTVAACRARARHLAAPAA